MQKIILIALLLIVSSLGYAKIVGFDIDLTYNKENITKRSKVNVHAKLGHEFHVGSNNLKALFVANQYTEKDGPVPATKNTIIIKAKIYNIENGKEKLVSRPQIITQYGKEAIILIENSKSGEYTEMKIKPTQL